MIRIGHKGADALVKGNTIASFERAVEVGVDMIELDALWVRGRHVVAHDHEDYLEREVHTLDEVLDAFTRPPLDQVEIDIDIKGSHRERPIIDAVAERGLTDRVMASGLGLEAIDRLRGDGCTLRLGWTVPQARRARDRIWIRRPFIYLAIWRLRGQLPGVVAAGLRDRDIHAVWAHEALVSRALVVAAHDGGAKLMAWTVDKPRRVAELRALGVDGICSNDPRLLQPPPNVPQTPAQPRLP